MHTRPTSPPATAGGSPALAHRRPSGRVRELLCIARQHSFPPCESPKAAYLEALSRVPVFSEIHVKTMMPFFSRLAHLIGEMGYSRKRLDEVNAELRNSQETLQEQVVERTEELSRANRQLQEEIAERIQSASEREKLIGELQQALSDVKTLSGMFPICARCKKIRDDKGYWNQIENYISRHSDAIFSHGICPECIKKLYPDFVD